MLRTIPFVAQERCFALKGGTAINFFVRDFPRLSVDIDLVYLPIEERAVSLANIGAALDRIAAGIRQAYPTAQVRKTVRTGKKQTAKLVVRRDEVQITIEPNEVIRGTVFPSENRSLVPKAEAMFEISADIATGSLADLYGGKLCAALDRQHPRDVFDVMLLLENEGITDDIRRAFVVYLASHDRPIHELLDPRRKDLRQIFEQEFAGMTTAPITIEQLNTARETYIDALQRGLTSAEKKFLVSVKTGAPQWDLLPVPGIERLPAIQWKLANIARMEKRKHADMLAKLTTRLGL